MTKDQESFFAMALKVKNFYAKITAAIGLLAAVVPFFTQLITADMGSRADITGYAKMKATTRKALEALAQKISNHFFPVFRWGQLLTSRVQPDH